MDATTTYRSALQLVLPPGSQTGHISVTGAWSNHRNVRKVNVVIGCEQIIEYCLDYIEGDLPDDEQARFRRHLGQCPDCVTFFETYRRTPEVSRELLGTTIPPSVKESVRIFLRGRRDR